MTVAPHLDSIRSQPGETWSQVQVSAKQFFFRTIGSLGSASHSSKEERPEDEDLKSDNARCGPGRLLRWEGTVDIKMCVIRKGMEILIDTDIQ